MKISDNNLIKWYKKGFSDELNGTTSIESDNKIENKAYNIGATHAIIGDDVKSVDYLSNDEILEIIKGE